MSGKPSGSIKTVIMLCIPHGVIETRKRIFLSDGIPFSFFTDLVIECNY